MVVRPTYWITPTDEISPLIVEYADALTLDTRKHTYESKRAYPQTKNRLSVERSPGRLICGSPPHYVTLPTARITFYFPFRYSPIVDLKLGFGVVVDLCICGLVSHGRAQLAALCLRPWSAGMHQDFIIIAIRYESEVWTKKYSYDLQASWSLSHLIYASLVAVTVWS